MLLTYLAKLKSRYLADFEVIRIQSKMKKLILLSFVVAMAVQSIAQCVIEPFSLQKRVYLSDMIVEAELTDQRCIWDVDKKNIYTVHTLKVFKYYDGTASSNDIQMVTMGGRVGLEMLVMEPSLQIQPDEFGVFLLKENKELNALLGIEKTRLFSPSASVQSFVKYDPNELTAHSYFKKYEGLDVFKEELISYTEKNPIIVEKPKWEVANIESIATPVLSSWNIDTATAGTRTLLVLNGSNYGITRGSGKVEFLDANYGDGRYYKPRFGGTTYKSWSNSKIEIYVPSRAGTGKIRITNKNGESLTTSVDLFIKYSHLNVSYWSSTVDSAYNTIDQVNDNGNGGYSWSINKKFRAHPNAVNSFMRSIETWRCGTLMNWNVGADTKTDDYAKDNINIVRWTKFGDSKLGVCGSRYSGCFSGGNLYWHLAEMDIEFDSTRNWYYGTGTPRNNQYDFQTVCTHELGHGHQLGHVNDNKKIMHYSLSNGDRRVALHEYDVEGGEYVRDKSKVSNPCGPSKVRPIQLGNCNITSPKANFTISSATICPNVITKFTSTSEGTIKSYKWDFGSDASMNSSVTKGPHNLYYINEGDKTVRLIVSNDFGADTATKTVNVLPPEPDTPTAFTYDDSVCSGLQSYSVNEVIRATEYLWELPMGGNIEGSAKLKDIKVDWVTPGGPHQLTVRAVNSCGSSDSVEALIHVSQSAKAGFTSDVQGRVVNFTFTGKGADSYSWDFGDNSTSSDKDPSHTFPNANKYTVKLIVSNNCSDDTIEEDITTEFGTGIMDPFEDSWKVYPNPALDMISLESSSNHGLVKLFSADGKLISTRELDGLNKVNISLNGFDAGIYFIELETIQFRARREFMKL